MYYVYEWYRKDTDEIIYVGKGHKNRYKVRKHNNLFNEMISKYDCTSRIVKHFDNETDAFKYEAERIVQLKSIGQCSCNIQAGGYGGDVASWDDDKRRHYSEHNVMKQDKQRERMSINNPMKNKDVAMRVGKTKHKPVIIGNKRFETVFDAKEHYHVCYPTVKNWCKKGINPFGELCRYESEAQHYYKLTRYNSGGMKGVTYLGKHYEAAIDLAKATNHTQGTITSWCKRGFDPDGNPCRYDNDTRELTYEDARQKAHSNRPKRNIIVNGVKYASCEEACEKLGLKKSTLYTYLNGYRQSKKYICKYDNQQPSQRNSNNSTLEGSTTNE